MKQPKLGLIRQWVTSIGSPYGIVIYWYGSTLKEEMKNKRFHCKIRAHSTLEFYDELPEIHKRIPNCSGLGFWKYVEKEGEYFIFTPDKG